MPENADVIMVVDDNDTVRRAIIHYLRAVGYCDYQITDVSSSIWAITDMERVGPMIKFLITDLDLTGHGAGTEGFGLARMAMEICGLKPDHIIILTGLPPEQLPEDLKGCILMAKPVGMGEIVKMIKAAGVEPDGS